MSNAMSKGTMSAFQRWEMASFGEEAPTQTPDQLLLARETARANQREIDSLREEARRLGFAEGHANGLADGKIAGQIILDAEIEQIRALTEQFSEQLSGANKAIGEDVFKLALELAQAMIRGKLELDPEAIIPVVIEAIDALPSVQQPAQINLHPADAGIIKAKIGEQLAATGWRIVSDPRIERGGCTLETAQNLIDASVETRWKRLSDAVKMAIYTPGAA
jgi:flagellar assembly protein FliH